MANGNQNLQSLLQTVRNNFSTFLLGLTVLLVIILVISLSAGGQKEGEQKSWAQNLAEMIQGKPAPTETPKQSGNTYIVKEGDSLWTIAEESYGSGYNFVDIASANKLANPDLVEVGQSLVIPSVAPKTPTAGEMAMAATGKAMAKPSSYTVVEGDSLWTIAQTYYGDGYAWSKIAQTNKLANPDVIQPGTKLSLP